VEWAFGDASTRIDPRRPFNVPVRELDAARMSQAPSVSDAMIASVARRRKDWTATWLEGRAWLALQDGVVKRSNAPRAFVLDERLHAELLVRRQSERLLSSILHAP